MRIQVFFGVAQYGRVNEPGGSYRETKFFHIWYLPILPVGGIRGVRGGGEEDAPMSALSLLMGYFKVYGFLASLLALFVITVAITKTNEPLVLAPVAGGVLFLMALVVSTWFWVGADPATSAGKRIGRTLAVLAPFTLLSGIATYSSYSDQRASQRREEQQAQNALAAVDQQEATAKKGILAAVEQHVASPGDKLVPCTTETLESVGITAKTNVRIAEAAYLRAAATGENFDAVRDNGWLVSKSIRLDPAEKHFGVSTLRDLSQHDLLAVVSLDPPPPSPPRGAPPKLTGKITFHEMPSGRGLCGTAVTATAKPLPKTPPETALRIAFIESADKTVNAMHGYLYLGIDPPASGAAK